MSDGSSDTTEGDSTTVTDAVQHREYDLLADVELTHPRLPLTRATSRARETIVKFEYRQGGGGKTDIFFTAAFGDLDAFEAGLAADDTVQSAMCLAVRDGSRVYRATLSVEAFEFFEEIQSFDTFVQRIRGSDGSWSIRMQADDRAAIVSIKDYCRDHGVEMKLKHLRSDVETGSYEYFGLSPSQCEMLRFAHRNGYYSVPRQITQTRLATSLGVSTSAISKQLRRATATLIAETLCE